MLAGRQQVPGVYLATSTALGVDDDDPHAAAEPDSYAAGLAALSGPQRQHTTPSSSNSSGTNRAVSGSISSSPQHAPLMHAGRPTRMGSPVAVVQSVRLQQHGAAAAQEEPVGATSDSCDGITTSSISISKGPLLDVYGQPRVVSPSLPATYSKVCVQGSCFFSHQCSSIRIEIGINLLLLSLLTQAHAAGSLNADYLAREGATLRTTKTSSAQLVRASGKDGECRASHDPL